MPPLSGAWNFRDVAENAGIKPGRLFRSGELSNLDDDGRATLTRFGITDVADLRSAPELERSQHSAWQQPAAAAAAVAIPARERAAADPPQSPMQTF